MALAHDNTTPQHNSASSSSESFDHEITGSNPTLVATIITFDTLPGVIDTITYDGVAMTERAAVENNWTTSRYLNIFVYTLDNPSTGLNTFSVTFTESVEANAIILSSYTDANNGVGPNTGGDTGNGTAVEDTFTTSESDSLIVGGAVVLGVDPDPFETGTGLTQRAEDRTGTNANTDFGYITAEKAATGGSDLFDFTANTSNQWALAAIELLANTGSPPPSSTPYYYHSLIG